MDFGFLGLRAFDEREGWRWDVDRFDELGSTDLWTESRRDNLRVAEPDLVDVQMNTAVRVSGHLEALGAKISLSIALRRPRALLRPA